jgi:NAD(P)-dependent dehydrogenase (short-subunit alcohol dehydrogenase family)
MLEPMATLSQPSGAKPLRAIVTGGGANIGRAIAEALLATGGRVAIGQRNLAAAVEWIERYGDRVIAFQVDVSDAAKCRAFVDAAAEALGGLDVLVNNAAVTGAAAIAKLADLTPEHFEQVMRVNLGGALFCSQAAVPHLKRAGGGVIVHISSINALRPQAGAVVYAATKAGLTSITQSMARELAPDGIRVVAIAPGDIALDNAPVADAAMAAKGAGGDVANQTPLGRGRTADIGETVAFVCSPGARFVTGVTWVVDGGLLA